MLILDRKDVARLLTMGPLIDALEQGFVRLSQGGVVLPQRLATPIARHEGLHLSMPAWVDGEGEDGGTLAIKVVSVYPHNVERYGLPTVQAALLLHDAADGRLLALMDAESMTAMRTGAASGVATRRLAREDASSLLMVGAGALAFHQVEAVCAVRPITRVYVASRTGARNAELCARIGDRLGIHAEPAASVADAAPMADIICTATTANDPVIRRSFVRPGCHINATGAYTPEMCEVDAETVRSARVIVDQIQAAQSEAGDLIQAAGESIVATLVAGELGDLVAGRVQGRSSADEITLFKSVGLAMQDAVAAALIYAAARREGAGTTVDLG